MKTLSLLLPGISFIIRGRNNSGVLCLLLQLSLVGWLPAAIWAYATLDEDMKKHRVEKILRSIKAFPAH
ncbi:MAG: YqaE/Pmp3 family membrane protein [Chitinophagaceae bacterium]|nr:YqaE/Pmp3 family membrane protein [Chitinophagaceae bacterium]